MCAGGEACGGLAQSWQHAAVRVSTRSMQPDGTSAKRALRAAAPPVPGTAGRGRLFVVEKRRRGVGHPHAEAENVGACPGWQRMSQLNQRTCCELSEGVLRTPSTRNLHNADMIAAVDLAAFDGSHM